MATVVKTKSSFVLNTCSKNKLSVIAFILLLLISKRPKVKMRVRFHIRQACFRVSHNVSPNELRQLDGVSTSFYLQQRESNLFSVRYFQLPFNGLRAHIFIRMVIFCRGKTSISTGERMTYDRSYCIHLDRIMLSEHGSQITNASYVNQSVQLLLQYSRLFFYR